MVSQLPFQPGWFSFKRTTVITLAYPSFHFRLVSPQNLRQAPPTPPPIPLNPTTDTMISSKDKSKAPKDSMTLLPCFYFVEVSGIYIFSSVEGKKHQVLRGASQVRAVIISILT